MPSSSVISSLDIRVGDCRQLLREIPDESVQCCVTSPPYWGLRDYGYAGQIGQEGTPEAFVQAMVEVFREVRRVLKKDGTCWVNLGDSYANDTFGQGGKSKKQSSNGGTVHDLTEAERYRGIPDGLKRKDLVGIPWMTALALRADGWYLRSDIIWNKVNPMPESVTDRPTKSHEYIFLLTKSESYYYDKDAIAEAAVCDRMRGPALHGDLVSTNGNSGLSRRAMADTRNKRSVWTVPTVSYKGSHFATYPPDLIKPCIMAGTKNGDVVLDPFGGSGTTGQVAIELGRRAILLELNPDYAKIIQQRTNVTMGLAL